MPDIESLLADVTYLTVLSTDAASRIRKKLVLPDILQTFISEKLILKDCEGEYVVNILGELLGRELFVKFCETLDIPDFTDIIVFYHNIITRNVDPTSIFSERNMEPEQLYDYIDSRITAIRSTLCTLKSNSKKKGNNSFKNLGKNKDVSKSFLGPRRDNVAFSELNLNSLQRVEVNLVQDEPNSSPLRTTQSTLEVSNTEDSLRNVIRSNASAPETQSENNERLQVAQSAENGENSDSATGFRHSEEVVRLNSQELPPNGVFTEVKTGDEAFMADYAGFCVNERLTELATRIKLELIYEVEDAFFGSKYYFRYLQWKGYHYHNKISLSHFLTQRIIGRGGYGEVYGCLKSDSGFLYAVKIQDKKRIKKKRDERGVLTEKALLTKLNFPFIVSLFYAFQTQGKLIFILDLLEGGDLRYNMSVKKKYTEEEIMFYARQIILTMKYLHSKNILYRDLKPANILLDAEGNTKLIDFGLATYCADVKKSGGAVGTYGYMAPEILRQDYYNYAVDWFSFGCIMFKFIEGSSPFGGHKKVEEIKKATLEKEPEITKPCSENMKSFVRRLLEKDQNERAGSKKFPIMLDPFLLDVNWHDVYYKKYKPPVIPNARAINADDAGDIGQFNDFELRRIRLSLEDQEKYEDFYYFDEVRWQEEMYTSQFNSSNDEFWKRSAKMISDFMAFQRVAKKEECVIYGLLQKKDPFLRLIWSKKLIVLFQAYIVIMNTNFSSEKRFPLTDGFSISVIKAEDHSFNMHLKGNRFTFKATSESDYNAWIEAFEGHPRFKGDCAISHTTGKGYPSRPKERFGSHKS